MHMPLIDGLEVARLYNFAVTDPAKRIPIVMVTADSRPEIAADADLAGITRFLTKPLKPSMMIELINRLMRERGKEPVQRSPLRIAKQYLDFTENFARVIDEELLTELLQYMEGEERGEFFSEFFEDARTYIETLESGSDEEGIKKIRGGMHALSGSARMVGALKLASYARRIEFMSTSDIRQTMPHLQRELWHVLEESESALKKIAKLA
jgi:HPt (histidine-containing phosphotransfer) domain-containing protein